VLGGGAGFGWADMGWADEKVEVVLLSLVVLMFRSGNLAGFFIFYSLAKT
jgi:hypothetical protein